MKATYNNSFCMDNKCINYFEDMCMLCMMETGDEICPYNIEYIDKFERGKSRDCKSFVGGTNIGYISDEGFGEGE